MPMPAGPYHIIRGMPVVPLGIAISASRDNRRGRRIPPAPCASPVVCSGEAGAARLRIGRGETHTVAGDRRLPRLLHTEGRRQRPDARLPHHVQHVPQQVGLHHAALRVDLPDLAIAQRQGLAVAGISQPVARIVPQ